MRYNTSKFESKSLENTQDGVLDKWIEQGKHFKAGIIEFGEYSTKAPVIECICYDIAKVLGINSVKYELVKLHTKGNSDIIEQDFLVCCSKDYTLDLSPNDIMVSAYDFIKSSGFKLNDDLYNSIVFKFPFVKDDIDKMIIFDFIINNQDRHLNNFNFIFSNKGIRVGTLFDNERSLLCNMNELNYKKFLSDGFYNKQIDNCKPFRGHHYKQIKLVEKCPKINLNMDIDLILQKYKDYLTEEYTMVIKKLVEDRLDYVKELYF